MKVRFWIACFMLMISSSALSTHLVGGEIYYDCLGNHNYRITLKVYRDCGPNNTLGTGFDQQAPIGIFNNGVLQSVVNVGVGGITNIPVVINNPCLQVPPNICIQQAIYTTTVTLPPMTGGYDIVYQRCCRNPSIQNILTPSDYGNSYLAHIPDPGLASCNSSPRFNNYPPLVLCANEPFSFDHSATDPDGDVLQYEMFTPYHGANSTQPAPNPPSPPPFPTVIWVGAYNVNNQIIGAPSLGINPASGLLSSVPTVTGNHVVGVRVNEFRNGILISSTIRDFQFYVTNCNPITSASIPVQSDPCQGLTAQFNGSNSVNAQTWFWDFGDGTTSTAVSPSHTYATAGSYNVMLIINAGLTCADTAYSVYNMNSAMSPEFAAVDPQCITGNSFDFVGTGTYDPGLVTFAWDFGPFANPTTSALESPSGVVFSDSGHYEVSFTVTQFGCVETYTDTVIVFPLPQIDAVLPPSVGCAPYTVQFQDYSLSWTPVESLWSFGDGTFSAEASPTHTYPDIGVYDVNYTITVDSGCTATQTLSFPGAIVVNPSPVAEFSVSPWETDVFNPDFEITDMSAGAISWYYVFDPGDTLFQREGAFRTDSSGYIRITQWVINEYGCPDTAVHTVYVEPISTIYVPNAFTPNGNLINDTWQPVVRDLLEYEVYVFDRWGTVVFSATDPYEFWDGTFKGHQSPSDVYVWKIVYKEQDNIRRFKTGHVTLVR
jgi:gliding motility-associated-like protein